VSGRPEPDAGERFRGVTEALIRHDVERGCTSGDVAIQLGHQDGGRLVQTLYGHPEHDNARARLLASWDAIPAADVQAVRRA
jgi:hypothetical protein